MSKFVFITFKIANIASGNQEVSWVIPMEKSMQSTTFHGTCSGLGLLILKAHGGTFVTIANDSSSSIPKPDLKFPSSNSNCTDLNKWHVISVIWSNKEENLSNCCSNGEKLITFTTGNVKGSDYCYIGDFGVMPWFEKQRT